MDGSQESAKHESLTTAAPPPKRCPPAPLFSFDTTPGKTSSTGVVVSIFCCLVYVSVHLLSCTMTDNVRTYIISSPDSCRVQEATNICVNTQS